MTGIIIVGAIGLICAILLVVASHFLSVPIDTRVEDIRGFLPAPIAAPAAMPAAMTTPKPLPMAAPSPISASPAALLSPLRSANTWASRRKTPSPSKPPSAAAAPAKSAAKPRITTAPATCAACAALHRGKKSLRLRLPGLWRLRQGLQIRCALHRGWRCPCG